MYTRVYARVRVHALGVSLNLGPSSRADPCRRPRPSRRRVGPSEPMFEELGRDCPGILQSSIFKRAQKYFCARILDIDGML